MLSRKKKHGCYGFLCLEFSTQISLPVLCAGYVCVGFRVFFEWSLIFPPLVAENWDRVALHSLKTGHKAISRFPSVLDPRAYEWEWPWLELRPE